MNGLSKLEKARLEWLVETLMQMTEDEQEIAYHKMLAFVSGLHYARHNPCCAVQRNCRAVAVNIEHNSQAHRL